MSKIIRHIQCRECGRPSSMPDVAGSPEWICACCSLVCDRCKQHLSKMEKAEALSEFVENLDSEFIVWLIEHLTLNFCPHCGLRVCNGKA